MHEHQFVAHAPVGAGSQVLDDMPQIPDLKMQAGFFVKFPGQSSARILAEVDFAAG